jgi:glycosyltransferase involved in cell wall biosynthesis
VNVNSVPATGPVLVDVQATQSAHHRDRGVARYTGELASTLWARHPALVHSFLLNPDAAPPGSIEALVASGRLTYSDRVDVSNARVLHICSPFELEVPISRLWPARAATRGLRLAVTLYDLIPEIFAERYLADPGLRRRYRARLELVRAADLVLAISETTAADAVEHLQVPEERIVVVGGAAARAYDRPASRVDALQAARAAVPGLEDRFVLYTAGMDDRKNFQGLFRAWARLPDAVRARWQLVMVCAMDDSTRNHLLHLAREVGIEPRVLLPGFVADEVLRLLYQSTALFVFPSLYEGFGLPVAEALACGARVIGSGTSAVRELLDPIARFEPADDDAMAAAITRALTDEHVAQLLDAQARHPLPGWDAVADRTAEAYEGALARPRPPARRRPLVAFVTPLPPAPSGIADYSYRLIAALREHCDVEAYVDGTGRVDAGLGPPAAPDGIDVFPVRSLGIREPSRGGYDVVLYCVGNSEFHAGALAELRRRSGVVLAHEVRLTDLYTFAADEPGAVPNGFAGALAAMYDGALSSNTDGVRLGSDQAEAMGVLMVSEIVRLSDRFAVMSEFAASRVRLDVPPDAAERVVVVPFAMRDPVVAPTPAAQRELLVASFGVVHPVKQNALIVAALPTIIDAVPNASVAFVGPCSEQARVDLLALAEALGVADKVVVTGAVDGDEYASWLDRAAISVQLRRTANGESSAAVADCLGAGTAVVVTGIGAARELPADAVVAVGPSVAGEELGAAIADLLLDPARRGELARAGREYASECSFAAAARRLYEDVIAPAAVSGLSAVRLG